MKHCKTTSGTSPRRSITACKECKMHNKGDMFRTYVFPQSIDRGYYFNHLQSKYINCALCIVNFAFIYPHPLWNVENFSVDNLPFKVRLLTPVDNLNLSTISLLIKKPCCHWLKSTFPHIFLLLILLLPYILIYIYIILLFNKKEFSICGLPVKKVCWLPV